MKINITPLRQIEPKECSMVCLRMILSYYDKNYSVQEIYKELFKAYDGSSYNTEIARFAKNKGFKITCFTYHLYIIDPADSKLSKIKLTNKLKRELTEPWFDKENTLLVESTIRAIEDGVDIKIQKPLAKIIVSYLKKGIPLIASVNYAALHNTQGNIFEGHDIVLSGIENDNIIYIDPEHAKEEVISLNDLMFAIISRRAISTSSYLIAIEKVSTTHS